MGEVAFKTGAVWAALIGMYALCVHGIWPNGSGDWAAWVGAIGTIAAVLWGVWLYRRDLVRKLSDESERREISRRTQALHLCALLDGVANKLEFLQMVKSGAGGGGVGSFTATQLEIPGIEEIQGTLVDPTVFNAWDLLEFHVLVARSRAVNQTIREHASLLGGGTVSNQALTNANIERIHDACSKLLTSMWVVAIVDPVAAESAPPSPVPDPLE